MDDRRASHFYVLGQGEANPLRRFETKSKSFNEEGTSISIDLYVQLLSTSKIVPSGSICTSPTNCDLRIAWYLSKSPLGLYCDENEIKKHEQIWTGLNVFWIQESLNQAKKTQLRAYA